MALKKFIITTEVEVEESSIGYVKESINDLCFDISNGGNISLDVSEGESEIDVILKRIENQRQQDYMCMDRQEILEDKVAFLEQIVHDLVQVIK